MTKPYYQDSAGAIYCKDCRDMSEVTLGSVDLVVTSPPYYDLHDYQAPGQIGYGQTYSEYISSLVDVSKEISKLLHRQGNYFLNIMDVRRDNRMVRIADDIIHGIGDLFILQDQIVWFIPNKMPVPNDRFLSNKFEWLLHFVLSADFQFNKDRIRIPHSHWSKTDRRAWKYNPEGRCPGNVWEIPALHVPNPSHPAMFPKELVERIILGWSEPNDLVLDPFLGLGTTAWCAKKLGRKFIGCEINEGFCQKASNRCRQMALQLEV